MSEGFISREKLWNSPPVTTLIPNKIKNIFPSSIDADHKIYQTEQTENSSIEEEPVKHLNENFNLIESQLPLIPETDSLKSSITSNIWVERNSPQGKEKSSFSNFFNVK